MKKIILWIFLFIILFNFISAKEEAEESQSKFLNQIQKAQESGEPVDTSETPTNIEQDAPSNTPFTQNDKRGEMGGLVQVNPGGTINAEDLITQSNDEGRGVESFSYTNTGYNIGQTDFWQTSDFTVFNGQGIQKSSNAFTVKKAEKIELNNMTLTDAELLYVTEDELSIVSADKVEGNGLKADNIINSTYSVRP